MPVTGRWQARRHGVNMGAGTQAALLRMIEQRASDDRARRQREETRHRERQAQMVRTQNGGTHGV